MLEVNLVFDRLDDVPHGIEDWLVALPRNKPTFASTAICKEATSLMAIADLATSTRLAWCHTGRPRNSSLQDWLSSAVVVQAVPCQVHKLMDHDLEAEEEEEEVVRVSP